MIRSGSVRSLAAAIAVLVLVALLAIVARGDGSADQAIDSDAPAGSNSEVNARTASTTTSTTVADATTSTLAPPDAIAAGECPSVPVRPEPDPDRPTYEVSVFADPTTGSVTGQMSVRFTPDLATDELVFRLWPNGPRPAQAGARLSVGDVTSEGAVLATLQPDATTLIVTPPEALEPGETITVSMPFELDVPGSVKDRISRSGESLRLGSFLPLLAWQPGAGWATDPPTSGFAEATSSPTAAWEVTIDVPDGFDVLASAPPSVDGKRRIDAARDFAMSVGRFETATVTLDLPHPVEVVVGVHAGVGEAPQVYLDRVSAALVDFSSRYGPYPFDSYTLAITPGLTGGIEFPGHVMQGPGSQGRTTPHEVAHMWFYGLVGNNQGAAPWLDEGLATYAEARFEGTLQAMSSREIPSEGRGRVGAPMSYWETRQGAYYRGVYVQGAAALAALGPPEAVDCMLSHYVSKFAHDLVTPAEALSHIELFFPDATGVLGPFGLPDQFSG